MTRDEFDSDLCSMISDMLRFLRIGFLLLLKELDLDSLELLVLVSVGTM